MLARERTGKGLSVAEISAQLRYSPKQIEALEDDDFARLPGTTFVRGMIRGYAKIVGTPALPILQAFESRHVPAPVAVDSHEKRVPFPDGRVRSTRVYLWLSMMVALLVAAVLYEWHFGLPGQDAIAVRAPVLEPASPAPVPEAVSEAAAGDRANAESPVLESNASTAPVATVSSPQQSGGAASLRFEFQKEAWLEVKDQRGQVLIAQINPAGSQAVIEGKPPFSLVIGNASNVRLTYGDKAVDFRQHIKVDVARFTLD